MRCELPRRSFPSGTPLLWACVAADARTLQLLIDASANVHALSDNSKAALNYLAYNMRGNEAQAGLKLLLTARCDVNFIPSPPTWKAACVSTIAAVLLGLGSTSKVARVLVGQTPLTTAAILNNAPYAQSLIEARADLNLPLAGSASAAAFVAENTGSPVAAVLSRALQEPRHVASSKEDAATIST